MKANHMTLVIWMGAFASSLAAHYVISTININTGKLAPCTII